MRPGLSGRLTAAQDRGREPRARTPCAKAPTPTLPARPRSRCTATSHRASRRCATPSCATSSRTARSARRAASTTAASRWWTSAPASPIGRAARPWQRGHAAARLLGDQGRHRDVRACCSSSAARSTSTRRSRATGPSSRRTARSASRCAGCCRTARARRDRGHLHARRSARLAAGGAGARRAGAATGSRAPSTAITRSLRLAARRAGAPRHRALARPLLRRGDRRAARPRVLDRPAGEPRRRGVSTLVPPEPAPAEMQAMLDRLFAPDTHRRPRLHRSVEPLPLRRDVEPARAARGRAAVLERHRHGARAGAALRGAGRRSGRRAARLRADTVERGVRGAVRGPGRGAVPADALRARLHAAAGARARRPDRRRSGTPAPAARSPSPIATHGLGFGYVMNRMSLATAGDPRADALVAAVYRALDA